VKSVKTTEDGAPEGQKVLSAEAPAWSLPDGRGLVEFALAAGFLVPQLMGSDSERRGLEVNEAGLPSAPLRTRSK
jgi:hypothetical protein